MNKSLMNETELNINTDWISPNFGDRKGHAVDMLVMHYTAMSDLDATLRRLCDAKAQVSAHYLISRDGEIFRLVSEDKRAWHAGVSAWRDITDVNSYSIGIELDHVGVDDAGDFVPYPAPLLKSLQDLSQDILGRYEIPMRNVVGHSDVAPLRKQDPGNAFPWKNLSANGIGLWPKQVPSASYELLKQGDKGPLVEELQSRFHQFGYGITIDGDFGDETHAVVIAFQRHFCAAKVDGLAGNDTQNMLLAVLQSI